MKSLTSKCIKKAAHQEQLFKWHHSGTRDSELKIYFVFLRQFKNGNNNMSKPKASINIPVQRLIFLPRERTYKSVSFTVKTPNKASIAPKTTNKSPIGILMSMSIVLPPTKLKLL